MSPAARARHAFTLIELLIVITIISILAGLIMGAVAMVKQRARILSTEARMQAILAGLSQYGSLAGSPAVGLQAACGLGGAAAFAPIRAIDDSIVPACARPPGFVQWVYVPKLVRPDGVTPASTVRSPFDATTFKANPERMSLWTRLIDEVSDVMPPAGATWSVADYADPAVGGWPTQWPETDWDQATPGSAPPILRFPWGKPGLRVDGSLCDPAQDSGSTGTVFSESATSTGHRVTGANPDETLNPQETVMNRWVTTGNASTGRIWQWSADDVAQTDSVRLTRALRSDGSGVAAIGSSRTNSNAPLPFDLGWLSPLASIELLQAAGVLPQGAAGAERYRTDRALSAPWNDAWGHPLLVVYALYQPERYVRAFDGENRRNFLMRAATKAYQYNRSLYLSVAAPGPTLAPGLSTTWAAADDAMTLRDYWLMVRDVAGAVAWTEASFASPPWKGIRSRKKNGCMSMLTAPSELK